MSVEFETALRRFIPRINRWLDRYLPAEDKPPQTLHRAMRYAVFAGGKRLRPFLVCEAFRWVGGRGRTVYPAACAVELIHTYSLIHDDLPALDNDDYRRGKPTCHRVFGEAIAILAGDALHALAFELLAKTGNVAVVNEIAKAIGTGGLVGGQVADVEMEGKDVGEEDVRFIHERKTAALFVASVRVGAILGGANPKQLASLTKYAKNAGLAFQITDDILDIKGDRKKLGKSTGADEKLDKATYPKAVGGTEKARAIAKSLVEKAKSSLLKSHDNRLLYSLADFIIRRTY